jgi:hypothetical protein
VTMIKKRRSWGIRRDHDKKEEEIMGNKKRL